MVLPTLEIAPPLDEPLFIDFAELPTKSPTILPILAFALRLFIAPPEATIPSLGLWLDEDIAELPTKSPTILSIVPCSLYIAPP